MGLFKTAASKVSDIIEDVEATTNFALSETTIDDQFIALATVFALLVGIHFIGKRSSTIGERKISLHGLNDANIFKEVFLAYLCAAVLEPIAAITSSESLTFREAATEFMTILSICSWIQLITDSFSFEDVTSYFKYHVDIGEEFDKDPKKYPWFQLLDRKTEALKERDILSGSLRKDVALWFLLIAIASAWTPGGASHHDVAHAYVIVFMWIIMHHECRKATAWESSYLVGLFLPSTVLLPMEYCLPLMDVADTVEDMDFLVRYRTFVKARTGVDIIIVT